jgi:hypothetical protein
MLFYPSVIACASLVYAVELAHGSDCQSLVIAQGIYNMAGAPLDMVRVHDLSSIHSVSFWFNRERSEAIGALELETKRPFSGCQGLVTRRGLVGEDWSQGGGWLVGIGHKVETLMISPIKRF